MDKPMIPWDVQPSPPCQAPDPSQLPPPCPPVPPQPPAPPAYMPGCKPWMPGQIPPVPTVLQGSSVYEVLCQQNERVNLCIQQWNEVSKNCYAALNSMVEAAKANDVYYDPEEVHYTTGYSTEDSCAYSIVFKKSLDKTGWPIPVKLALAYDNTTNSGIKQDIFDVSYIKSANVILTAVPPAQTNWYGPACHQCAPIPGTVPDTTYYVYGFNRDGNLKVFAGENLTDQILMQNQMVDVLGGCIPVIQDGQVLSGATELTTKSAIGAIGWRASDNTLIFFSCSAQDQPGMMGVTVANLLQSYNCTTAVLTYCIAADNKNEQGGMLYMAQMAAVPQGGVVPSNLAYWYISKKPKFRNKFQSEVANLIQITGKNAWNIYLSHVELGDMTDRITANYNAIQAEVQRATAAESALSTSIDGLKTQIQDEIDRATTVENELQTDITNEVTRATDAENNLQININSEVTRATAAEAKISSDLTAETSRAKTAEAQVQENLTAEINARIAADNELINSIEQEILARKAADTSIQATISKLQADTDASITEIQDNVSSLTQQVDNIKSGDQDLPYLPISGGTMTGDLSVPTVTLGSAPTADMEAATKQYVDQAVSAGVGPDGVSKEYVDGQIDTRLALAGGTMTGNLTAPSVTITEEPSKDTDAVTKKYVDDAIVQGGSGSDVTKAYVDQEIDTRLPLAGGAMTGDLTVPNISLGSTNTPGEIHNLSAPTEDSDPATKAYVDTATENLATEAYVNTQIETATENLPTSDAVNQELDTKLNLSGGTLTGTLTVPNIVMSEGGKVTNLATPTQENDAATKAYVDSQIGDYVTQDQLETGLAQKLSLTGGTLTGQLVGTTGKFGGAVDIKQVNLTTSSGSKAGSIWGISDANGDGIRIETNTNPYAFTLNGAQKIGGVIAGTAPFDVVNFGQLSTLQNIVNNLSNKVPTVDATGINIKEIVICKYASRSYIYTIPSDYDEAIITIYPFRIVASSVSSLTYNYTIMACYENTITENVSIYASNDNLQIRKSANSKDISFVTASSSAYLYLKIILIKGT